VALRIVRVGEGQIRHRGEKYDKKASRSRAFSVILPRRVGDTPRKIVANTGLATSKSRKEEELGFQNPFLTQPE
jgi:hypothetical protein